MAWATLVVIVCAKVQPAAEAVKRRSSKSSGCHNMPILARSASSDRTHPNPTAVITDIEHCTAICTHYRAVIVAIAIRSCSDDPVIPVVPARCVPLLAVLARLLRVWREVWQAFHASCNIARGAVDPGRSRNIRIAALIAGLPGIDVGADEGPWYAEQIATQISGRERRTIGWLRWI